MRKENKMDYLAPPLNAVLQIQLKIKSGLSVRSSIKAYVKDFPDCPFAKQINLWLFYMETGKPVTQLISNKKNYRKTLLDILSRGLKGEPILCILQEFELELNRATLQDLEYQVHKLPFLSLIPLFLFQIPAFFLLLLGPLLLELQKNLSF